MSSRQREDHWQLVVECRTRATSKEGSQSRTAKRCLTGICRACRVALMSASSHDAIRQYSTSATLSVLRYRVAQVCALCSPPRCQGCLRWEGLVSLRNQISLKTHRTCRMYPTLPACVKGDELRQLHQ